MLSVEHLSTGYGKKQVLFDVSFEVEQGEIALLIGSNGSGKSTLLKSIYGLLPLWDNTITDEELTPKGSICFDCRNITGSPTSKLLELGLLYIPQQNSLFSDLTVKENLEMAGLTIKGKVALRERIENALETFPLLASNLHRTPSKLSGGERQLLTLAMATLHKPRMILIDEPFNGLSPKSIDLVSGTLTDLRKNNGVTIIMVEHRVKESLVIANKIICLKLGKIYCIMPANKDFDFQTLQKVFV